MEQNVPSKMEEETRFVSMERHGHGTIFHVGSIKRSLPWGRRGPTNEFATGHVSTIPSNHYDYARGTTYHDDEAKQALQAAAHSKGNRNRVEPEINRTFVPCQSAY